MPVARLKDRGVVRVVGESAKTFLQGLVTQDLATLSPGGARYTALLSPQGKVVADFFIYDNGESLLIDVPRDILADLVRRLTFYRLRARVTFEDATERFAVMAAWADAGNLPGLWFVDPRLPALGSRGFVDDPSIAADADDVAFDDHRLALGIPEGGRDYAYGAVFAHEIDLDQLDGVDFRKGCFIGQEVVSRMQHRGTARSRFVPVRIDGAAPPAGTDLVAAGRVVGQMGSARGARGLALLRLDRLAEIFAAGETIGAGSAILTPVRPDWARFEWPAA